MIRTAKPKQVEFRSRVVAALAALEGYPGAPTSLGQLAQDAGVSPSNLASALSLRRTMTWNALRRLHRALKLDSLGIEIEYWDRAADDPGALAAIIHDSRPGDPADFDRAIAILRSIEDPARRETAPCDWMNTLNAIALTQASKGEVVGDPKALEDAISNCETILGVVTRDSYRTWWAMVMVTLCSARVAHADLTSDPAGFLAAAEQAAAALSVATEDEIPAYWTSLMLIAADARYRLGRRLRDAGQFERAISLADTVLASERRAQRDRAAALVRRARAKASLAGLEVGSFEAAIADFDAALALVRRDGAPGVWANVALARAEATGCLGARNHAADTLAAAAADFTEVLTILSENDPRRGAAYLGRGNAILAQASRYPNADPAGAAADFRAARAALDPDLDPVSVVEAIRGEAAALLLAADWEGASRAAGGLLDRAGALIAGAAADHEQLRLADAMTGLGDIAALAELRCGRIEAALSGHEAGRAHRLRDDLRMVEADLAPRQAAELQSRRRRLEVTMRALSAALEEDRPVKAVAALDDRLREAHSSLRDFLDAAGLSSSAPPPDLADIRSTLGRDVLAIPVSTLAGGAVIVVGGDATAIGAACLPLDGLTSDVVEEIVAPPGGAGWLGAYADFRRSLASRDGGGYGGIEAWNRALSAAGAAVWTHVIGPLDAYLRSRGLPDETEIILIPYGPLAALPLHAAGEGDRCLLDRWAVSYAPSVSALMACRNRVAARPEGPERLLAVTDPELDLARPDNPAADAFAPDRIDAFHGSDARRAPVLAALPRAGYASFFTHAVWDPDHPERSAIRLAAGDRIEARDFGVVAPGTCRMVVLGACESGVPSVKVAADEVCGFPTSLISAGVPAALATLWPVFNHATDRVLRDFFRHHFVDGLPPAVALRRAQLACRQAEPGAEAQPKAMGLRRGGGPAPAAGTRRSIDLRLPVFWAAFALTGA